MILNIFKNGNAILNYHRICPDNDMSNQTMNWLYQCLNLKNS